MGGWVSGDDQLINHTDHSALISWVISFPSVYSCIFLELFTRRPVFQGNDEIHQLHVLTEVLGPATPDQWPGVQDLPWYDLVRPTAEEGTALSQHAVASEQQFRETFGE